MREIAMSLRVTNNAAKITITKMENNDIVSFLSTRLINYLNLTKKYQGKLMVNCLSY